MLIIKVEPGEGIDKAVKRYKRKIQRTQVLRQLRRRKNFVKPSVKRRAEVLKAKYIQDKYGNN